MVYSQYLGERDLAQVAPCEDGLLHEGIKFGKEGRPAEHAEDAPEGVVPSLAERAERCAGTIAEHGPADPEDEPSEDVPPEGCGFYGQLDKPQVFQQVDPDHRDEDRGEHIFYDGHVEKPESSQLFIIPDHPGLLEQEAENDACYQSIDEVVHCALPPR